MHGEALLNFYQDDNWFASYAGKRVLVTGAGGFIPSHLTEALLLAGANVTALVKYNGRGDIGNLRFIDANLRENLTIQLGDITDAPLMRQLVKGQDVVFHLAALIGIPYSYIAPQHYVNTNVQGTLNVLEACRENITPLVHTSTSETYGTALYTPIDEAHPLQGQSPYSASKVGADMLAESYYRSFDLPVRILRPFNTFGPRQSARAFIPSVIHQLYANGAIEVGSLDPKRDLSPVWDTVRGFLAIGASDQAIGELINIGNGKTQTMRSVLDTILHLHGDEAVTVSENAPERVRPEKSEVFELLADTKKAERLLSWRPRLTLEHGLKACLGFYKLNQEDASGYRV
jgi:NAD dependent epimerase/dehydratase